MRHDESIKEDLKHIRTWLEQYAHEIDRSEEYLEMIDELTLTISHLKKEKNHCQNFSTKKCWIMDFITYCQK